MTVDSAAAPSTAHELGDDPSKDVFVGGAIAVAFFVLFLGWAAVVPLDAGAYARGVVAISGNRQSVQHRDGGVVTALRVQEGQRVRKGQVLLEISASDLRAAERSLASQVYSLLAQRARLSAERNRAQAIMPPPEFAALTGEDAVLAGEAMRLQTLQFQARRELLQTQHAVLSQQARQLAEQIAGNARQLEANQRQQKLIAEELSGVKELARRGYASMSRVRMLERDVAGLQGSNGAYRAEMAKSREAIGESRLQSVAVDRQMMDEITGELRDVELKLGELLPALATSREKLAHALVRAPASGEVVGLTAHTVGGVVAQGQVLMEVVPSDKNLVVEASVSPNDADDLRVGQMTQVRFPALHERSLPTLEGRLTKLSADSFVDERSGERFFKAEISVPPAELAAINKVRGRATLRPGLPVDVVIPLRKRTALQYLLEPLTQTFWRSFLEH